MQKSIEVEYWVVDRDGALTTPGGLTDLSEYVVPEFVEPLVELKTPPCESIDVLERTFVEQLHGLLTAADELDRYLVPLGTPIHAEPIHRLDSERGDIQHEVLGADFEYAKYCAGTHLHFEQRNVVDQLNLLISLDPALALTNSSPYHQGEWLADSARAYLYRKQGYANYPKHGQRWSYVSTVAEWKRRLDDCFAEFRTHAVDAGVAGSHVDQHFTPDTVVWTPVRLRDAMPTVEWRSPDATIPSEILRLAAELDDLMEHIHHTNVTVEGTRGGVESDRVVLPEFETVTDLGEQAIHEGVASPAVTDYLERMGFDVAGYAPLSKQFDETRSLTLEEARERRVSYGKLLARDVNRLYEACVVNG